MKKNKIKSTVNDLDNSVQSIIHVNNRTFDIQLLFGS